MKKKYTFVLPIIASAGNNVAEATISHIGGVTTTVQVQPDLEIVSREGLIHIVENYSFLAVVAVPPNVLGLEIVGDQKEPYIYSSLFT